MKPIYEPKGKAKEYGDYAINIYTGCPHRCYYCFAPSVLRRDREQFHSCVAPRAGIVDAVAKQLEREQITGKTIHLCFTCDPYPTGYDTTATREIIKLLKAAGNHVQILTKGDGSRDFDLLDGDDWYGITYGGYGSMVSLPKAEPHTIVPEHRIMNLSIAHEFGIKTWISFEPVLNAEDVLYMAQATRDYVDKVKFGKLNYHYSSINWKQFGEKAEQLCKELGLNYYIKESFRKEMEADNEP